MPSAICMCSRGHALRLEVDLDAAVGIAFSPNMNWKTTLKHHVAAKDVRETQFGLSDPTRGGGDPDNQNREAKSTHMSNPPRALAMRAGRPPEGQGGETDRTLRSGVLHGEIVFLLFEAVRKS